MHKLKQPEQQKIKNHSNAMAQAAMWLPLINTNADYLCHGHVGRVITTQKLRFLDIGAILLTLIGEFPRMDVLITICTARDRLLLLLQASHFP